MKLHNAANAEPIFLGARSIRELAPRLEHWIDLALVRGSEDGRDIRAWGFDAGLEYETELPGEIELSVGVAFCSGDANPGDAVDGSFRQTGLRGSYFYYGEVLAPELSNMWIATAGIGFSPADDISIDLLYHCYRQHEAAAWF